MRCSSFHPPRPSKPSQPGRGREFVLNQWERFPFNSANVGGVFMTDPLERGIRVQPIKNGQIRGAIEAEHSCSFKREGH